MTKPALALCGAALLVGCEAAAPPPPLVSLPPAPPAVARAPEGDVPFQGVYTKYAKLAYEGGRQAHASNDTARATLRVEPGKVTYDQSYTQGGELLNVVQVYSFGTADVRASGPDHFEVAMTFRRITGDTEKYWPDRDNVKLVAQRGASGWQLELFMTDSNGRGIGVGFLVDPPTGDTSALAARLAGVPGALPPPPDVAAPPRDAVQSPSGLATRVLSLGTGTQHPAPEDAVRVHYTGWTSDGRMVDSSTVRDAPATFRPNQLIKGWSEGLQLMVVGERRRLWIPANLAYGDQPRSGAPYGDLVFDVELLEITPAARPLPPPPDVKAPPPNARKTPSGLAYRILKKGPGKRSPLPGESAIVNYTGWSTDGKMFDSTTTRGEPATFPLNAVIKGFAEGLQLMKVGDVARFWIPPSLAYGNASRPGTPTGMLVYEVELVAIQ